MEYDTTDILGQPTLPVIQQNRSGESGFSVLDSIYLLTGVVVAFFVAKRVRREILLRRERDYKLETRRLHGIPDQDRRPFTVALNAARQNKEKKEEEERERERKQRQQASSSVQVREQHADQAVSHRPDRYRSTASVPLPGAYIPSYVSNAGSSYAKNTYDRSSPYSPSRASFNDSANSRRSIPQPYPDYHTTGSSRHAPRNIIDLTSDGDGRKRGFDEQDLSDAEPSKKTRVEDDELIDVDEYDSYDNYDLLNVPKRPSKRTLGDEDYGSDSARDKRPRKVSLDKAAKSLLAEEEDMDVDEEVDEVPELTSPVRGRKRDRAEAGSTFGGDDDDSAHEDDSKHRQRRRKRQNKRKSDVGLAHSKRRDMDVDEEMDSPNGLSKSRHRKNKRHSNAYYQDMEEYRHGSDISIDDSITSSTRTRGRRIGEEWESNGVHYKIGPNGQRLRQALVKRARNKFVMPKDSVHPDKSANLEVFVETWLTEEEYEDAKAHMLLAWQDSPKQSVEPENISVKIPPAAKEAPPTPVGKNLLWQSTYSTPNSSPVTPSPLESPNGLPAFRPKGLRNPGRYSLGANVGLRVNPFEKPPAVSTKRIVSASLVNASLSDKTNSALRPRPLSKWEKQEVEANAISQLRAVKQAEIDAKNKIEREKAEKEQQEKARIEKERQEKERLEKERLEKEKKEKEAAAAAAAAAAAPKVPSITVTQPSETNVASKPTIPSFSFTPSTSSTTATPAASTDAAKPNFFAPPAAATPSTSATPSPFGTTTSDTKPAATASSAFSFKPTTPAAPSTSQAATTHPAPSTFSFGPSSTTAKPSTSLFGTPAQPAAEQKKTEPAPTSTTATQGGFSFKPSATPMFGQPSTSSTTTTAPTISTAPSTAASTTTAPKFNFFGPSKPTTDSTTAPSTTSNTSTLTGALGAQSDASKPAATSPFSFKPTTTTTADAGKTNSTTATTASKFNFGNPTSAFGSNTTSGSTSLFSGKTNGTSASPSPFGQPSTSNAASSATSPFGQPSTTTAAPSPFGQPSISTTAAPSPFGQPSTITPAAPSPFGQPSSTSAFSFGTGAQDKGKEPAKSAFGTTGGSIFGNTASSSSGTSVFGTSSKPADATTSATAGKSDAPKPLFSFGAPSAAAPGPITPAASSNGATTTPKSAFNFGAPVASSTTTPSTTTPGGNPPSNTGFSFNFGKTAAPSAGATGSATTGGTNIFGAPSQPASAFGFGTPGANGTSTPGGTPAAPVFSFGVQK